MRIDSHLLQHDFNMSLYDPNLYLRQHGREIIIVVVHIDDMVIAGNIEELIASYQDDSKRSFDMIDLGLLHYYLGLEV